MKPESMAEMMQPIDIGSAESSMKVQFLHWCLSHLPDTQKEALVLYEIVGFSVREIAISLTVSEENVKKRLSRGRKKLKEIVTAAMQHEKGVKHE